MTRARKLVAIGSVSGTVTMAVAVWALQSVLTGPADPAPMSQRLAYALQWQIVPGLVLFAMIGWVGLARAASPAIDPTRGLESSALAIDIRVLDNTVQQLALFWCGAMALATVLPAAHLSFIAAAAIVFAVARIAFWIGYRINPPYRAAGFSATMLLNGAMLAAAVWFALTS